MIEAWTLATLGTFAGLLPIVNPFSTAVIFLTITQHFPDARRRQQARMACVYAAGILLACLFAGALIMEFFGIELPAIRVAGGLIVARIGFGMLSPETPKEVSEESQEEASHKVDVSFTPLAMPMMSGPGAIAVTLGMAAGAEGIADYLGIATGILLVVLIAWLVLRASRRVVTFLGVTGMNALTRIMGFLLICVGIQLIAVGTREVFSDPAFVQPVLDAVRGAGT